MGGRLPHRQRDGRGLSLWTRSADMSLVAVDEAPWRGGERTPPPQKSSRDRCEGTSSPWTRPCGWPWAMSSRTWPQWGKGSGCRRSEDGHGTATGVFASAGESAWTAVGDGFPDEAVRGRGSWGRSCGQGHETAVRITASADKSARTTEGDAASDEARSRRLSPPWTYLCQRLRGISRT